MPGIQQYDIVIRHHDFSQLCLITSKRRAGLGVIVNDQAIWRCFLEETIEPDRSGEANGGTAAWGPIRATSPGSNIARALSPTATRGRRSISAPRLAQLQVWPPSSTERPRRISTSVGPNKPAKKALHVLEFRLGVGAAAADADSSLSCVHVCANS